SQLSFRRIRIVSVAIPLANPAFSVMNEVLGFTMDGLSSTNFNGCLLSVMIANHSSTHLVCPSIAVRIRNRMNTVTLTHTPPPKSSYDHPLVLPPLMHL